MNESNAIQWKPDFERNWSKINLDTYGFIIKQAEKNFDELISESESITNKSIKILTFNSILFSFFFSYSKQFNHYTSYRIELVMPLILFLGVVFIVMKLMFPKRIRFKGFSPKDLLSDASNLDSEDESFHLQILYYITIVKLEDNILVMKAINTCRAKLYKISIIMSVVQLILMMMIIFLSF